MGSAEYRSVAQPNPKKSPTLSRLLPRRARPPLQAPNTSSTAGPRRLPDAGFVNIVCGFLNFRNWRENNDFPVPSLTSVGPPNFPNASNRLQRRSTSAFVQASRIRASAFSSYARINFAVIDPDVDLTKRN